MRIIVNGGGPAGLYFALLARKRLSADVTLFERNPAGATYGFGIVLADRGLNRLEQADAESYQLLKDACYLLRDRIMQHRGESICVEGGGYGGALARLRLLAILEHCCRKAGVDVHHGHRCEGEDFGPADLIVGADGVNSAVRSAVDREFGTSRQVLTNKLAWYGSKARFTTPILSFRTSSRGNFWAVGYAYDERMSTFVAECDANTWSSSLAELTHDRRNAIVAEVFAEELQGEPLISNNSTWGSLSVIRVKNWFVDNRVLIGDALHSSHPSIGSGTRIAMEDAIALCEALERTGGDVAEGLRTFRAIREPAKLKLVTAAESSIAWYEGIAPRLADLSPVELVFDYLNRTGRIDSARLAAEYPAFLARYGEEWARIGARRSSRAD